MFACICNIEHNIACQYLMQTNTHTHTHTHTHTQDDTGAIGSTLLDVMDRFALGPYDPEQGELEDTENIGEH